VSEKHQENRKIEVKECVIQRTHIKMYQCHHRKHSTPREKEKGMFKFSMEIIKSLKYMIKTYLFILSSLKLLDHIVHTIFDYT
jgi:hypothetical protein